MSLSLRWLSNFLSTALFALFFANKSATQLFFVFSNTINLEGDSPMCVCVNHVSFVYAWLSVWGDQLDPVILSDRALSCARAWLFMAVPDTERAFLAYTHVTKRTTLHVFTPWFCHLIDGLDDRKQVRFSVILSCICHIRAE
jgi:hypothetical protein